MSVRSNGINCIIARDLVNDNMLNDNGKDYYDAKKDKVAYYQGVSYLLSAIQRVEPNFVNVIVYKLRNRLNKLHINPDNIYLNEDVMKELETIITSNSTEKSNQFQSEKDLFQDKRMSL